MAKLYPPYIEGTLPAFIKESNTGNVNIYVPFEYNKGVGANEISNSFIIKVKSVQNDVLLNEFAGSIDNTRDKVAKFSIDKSLFEFQIGQYYKIQMAFQDTSGEIGYYSTVGVAKCTSQPQVTIVSDFKTLEEGKINGVSFNSFYGVYEQTEDTTEKLYSSYFQIKDAFGNIVYKSESNEHSVQNDSETFLAQEELILNVDLDPDEIYKLQFFVTTTNNLEVSSPIYRIQQQKSLPMNLKGALVAELDKEAACINVSIQGAIIDNKEEEVKGLFLLSREDSSNPNVWEEMTKFVLLGENPTKQIYKDFVIEQGKTYTYSLQQFNSNKIYSARKKSNMVFSDFDDMYLFDGERQLRLQFNPQVSNFKTQLAETRTETIGSKYPFFFRNARVGYKVFPISGLISMLMDEMDYFVKDKEILKENFNIDRSKTAAFNAGNAPYRHTDLLSKNIISERLFKLKVLDWFNDGKVKLFKSPTEGNYLVRLMETSMSPNTALGRTLHTINTTAYECADYNYKNLVKYNLVAAVDEVSLDEYEYEETWRTYTFTFENIQKNLAPVFSKGAGIDFISEIGLTKDMKPGSSLTSLELIDFLPGTEFYVGENIKIGVAGSYRVKGAKNLDAIQLKALPKDKTLYDLEGAVIKYSYFAKTKQDIFDAISRIENSIDKYRQVIGKHDNILADCNHEIERLSEIFRIDFHKRPIEYIYYKGEIQNAKDENSNEIAGKYTISNNNLYWTNESKNPIGTSKPDVFFDHNPFAVYLMIPKTEAVENQGVFQQYIEDRIRLSKNPENDFINGSMILDPWKENLVLKQVNPLEFYNIKYGPENNEETISLRKAENYSITNEIDLSSIVDVSIDTGVYAEVYYDTSKVSFRFFENTPPTEAEKDYNGAVSLIRQQKTVVDLLASVRTADEAYIKWDAAIKDILDDWEIGIDDLIPKDVEPEENNSSEGGGE